MRVPWIEFTDRKVAGCAYVLNYPFVGTQVGRASPARLIGSLDLSPSHFQSIDSRGERIIWVDLWITGNILVDQPGTKHIDFF